MNDYGMNGCFGCFGDNYCLWILILLLVLCCCKGGCLTGLLDKICDCKCLILALLVFCCCKDCGGKGGGCK